MTKEEAIKKLDALDVHEPEQSHCTADDCLVEFLQTNGAPDVAEAFTRAAGRVGFWYA